MNKENIEKIKELANKLNELDKEYSWDGISKWGKEEQSKWSEVVQSGVFNTTKQEIEKLCGKVTHYNDFDSLLFHNLEKEGKAVDFNFGTGYIVTF